MRSAESRRNLPLVLDEVHRRTLAARLQETGLDVQTGSWLEIEELFQARGQSAVSHDDINVVCYAGTHKFGPIFGGMKRLVESGPTRYTYGEYHRDLGLGEWMMKREILICRSDDPTVRPVKPARILTIPDVPPVALHGDACAEVEARDTWAGIRTDSALLEKVQALRPEAVELITEDAAAGIIRALMQDAASIAQV